MVKYIYGLVKIVGEQLQLMPKKKNLSVKIIDEIIRMYIHGEKLEVICATFDINHNTVYYHLKRFNIGLVRKEKIGDLNNARLSR